MFAVYVTIGVAHEIRGTSYEGNDVQTIKIDVIQTIFKIIWNMNAEVGGQSVKQFHQQSSGMKACSNLGDIL